MYKALIVDDEQAMIDGLKLLIPWEKYGFTLCGEASSAQEALNKITMLRPHLVITDIRMPAEQNTQLENGIDLIKETRKLGMYTEFVILSGYPDFNYAQTAIKNNVKRYLLKPLDKDEITDTLSNIKKVLDNQFQTQYGLTAEDTDFTISRDFITDFDAKLTNSIELMNLDEATHLVDSLFSWLKTQNAHEALILINSCVYIVLHTAFDRNIQIQIDTSTFSTTNLKTTKTALMDIITKVISLLTEERRKNTRLYLYEVKDHINQNYQTELSVASLAKMVHIDPIYLGKAFRDEFAQTISEYQHQLRIQEAIRLAESTTKSLTEISTIVGYNNYNNFFAHFEKITGRKPSG